MPDTIHILSAAAVSDGQLSMCGLTMGPYAEASKTHPVGNYMSVPPVGPITQAEWDRVTCERCRARMLDRVNQGTPL